MALVKPMGATEKEKQRSLASLLHQLADRLERSGPDDGLVEGLCAASLHAVEMCRWTTEGYVLFLQQVEAEIRKRGA